MNALATEAMDVRRATALLYGLQLASNNCTSNKRDHSAAKDPVEDTVTADDGTVMAPADRVPLEVIRREEQMQAWESMTDDGDEADEDAEEAEDEEDEAA